MDSKKILALLIALIIYTNYSNYIKVDVSKLYRKITTLEANIKREVEIQKGKYTKKNLELRDDKFAFNGKKYSYSKSMGAMQNIINKAAKDICEVKRVKWAQVPNSKTLYDKLRMDVSIVCTSKNLFILTNRLTKEDIIFVIESSRIGRDKNKDRLNINFQLVAFRMHK